ncbi:MAG: tripartite tricarboxylate transporter TctB family protein [Granulosicoccus sp.]
MIFADRLLGVVVFAFGCSLLIWIVPNYVTSLPGDPLDPSLFPKIAGWLITTLGLLQILFAKRDSPVPAAGEVLGFAAFVIALVVAATLLPRFGFLPVAIGLMMASLVLLRERRPLWALLTLFAVPAFVWFLFEILLQRSLS